VEIIFKNRFLYSFQGLAGVVYLQGVAEQFFFIQPAAFTPNGLITSFIIDVRSALRPVAGSTVFKSAV
jgi:hypothetical protein